MGLLLAIPLVLFFGIGMFIFLLKYLLRPTIIYVSVEAPVKSEPPGCLGSLVLMLVVGGVCLLLWLSGGIQFL